MLLAEAQRVGAKVFFADEAHFRADADLRGKWVLKGEPALVGSTSPRWGEKASYYSAVCLETGEVEVMEMQGNSNAETSTAFLKQLREKHTGPLNVIWDNAPAHHGDALRAYLATSGLCLRLVSLPGYSPDFNADEAIWDWAREEITANLCLGSKDMVQQKLGDFFAQLAYRTEEVKQRCRTVLQARAEELFRGRSSQFLSHHPCRFHFGFSLGYDYWRGSRVHRHGVTDVSTAGLARRVQSLRIPPHFIKIPGVRPVSTYVSLPVSGIDRISVFIPISVGFAAGFFAGLLGAGGGTILMPILIFVIGIPTTVAIGTDLFQIIITGSVGTFIKSFAGHVDPVMVVIMLVAASAGAQLGSAATRIVEPGPDSDTLRRNCVCR